jgi:hypothetical protein
MKQILVIVSRGIIAQVQFFNDASTAIRALSKFVKGMNIEHEDAALYDREGMIANAKHFLDDQEVYFENKKLIKEVSPEKESPIYIIGNPKHSLGFMVASPDDPLGYDDPIEVLSDLGQIRQDAGRHLKLYRVETVSGPLADRDKLKKHNSDIEVEGFDYSLIEEYLE